MISNGRRLFNATDNTQDDLASTADAEKIGGTIYQGCLGKNPKIVFVIHEQKKPLDTVRYGRLDVCDLHCFAKKRVG
jgi:hypothetical protein